MLWGGELFTLYVPFYIIDPPQQMNLTYNLMMVQWNPVNVTDYYIISISPLINDNESEFTLMTTNTISSNCLCNITKTTTSV